MSPMVSGVFSVHDGNMNRLLAPPNGAHLALASVALVARFVLGGIPLVGGLISFVLLIVILYQLARVAINMLRMRPAGA